MKVEGLKEMDKDTTDRITAALSEILGEKVDGFLLAVDMETNTRIIIDAKPRSQHFMASYLQSAVVQMELARQSD